MKKQSLGSALRQLRAGHPLILSIVRQLDGCPVGEHPETREAFRALLDLLPAKRSYTAHDLVLAAYDEVDGRYQLRRVFIHPPKVTEHPPVNDTTQKAIPHD